MCSHLFFPRSCSYSAVILETLQINIRGSPRLSLTRFNIFYDLKNLKFHFLLFWILKQQLRFVTICVFQQLTACKLQMVSSWDCAGLMVCLVWCVSQSKLLSVCLPFHLLFSVVSVPASQIVSARQQLYVPQREPKYPGNQASFSL